MSASKTDEMLNNDLESEFHEIAKNNPLIQYKIWEDGHHPLIATKAVSYTHLSWLLYLLRSNLVYLLKYIPY